MYILVWEPTRLTEPRVAAYGAFEDACIAIVKMPALSMPDHVIEMRPKVFDPGNFELKRTAMRDFLEGYRALLTHLSLRLLAEDMGEDP
jgi:hypothetical protein